MSVCSGLIIHSRVVPIKIAVGFIIIIGIFDNEFEWFCESSLCFIEIKLLLNIIRKEYDAVIPTEEIIMNVSMHSSFDEINFSIIISFEKYPDVKGRPISVILVILNVDKINGILK